MDKQILMFRGGVKSATKKLADGKEYTIFFKSRTPEEIAVFVGIQSRMTDDTAGDLARQKGRAEFIANSLCNEDGSLLMTIEEARMIPVTLKPQLCEMIITASNDIGDLGND
jgi:hypothetical protein